MRCRSAAGAKKKMVSWRPGAVQVSQGAEKLETLISTMRLGSLVVLEKLSDLRQELAAKPQLSDEQEEPGGRSESLCDHVMELLEMPETAGLSGLKGTSCF